MKPAKSNRRREGFTLLEMLVVIAIIGLLAALLLPVLAQGKTRAQRIECVSGLKEIGLAYHLFANDHGGKYPTQVSTNDGGAEEFVTAGYRVSGTFYFSYRYVLPLAGALATPKLFDCPGDLGRTAAINFNNFINTNLSYDIGLVSDANDPRQILAADRGLPLLLTNGYTIGHLPAPSWLQWNGAHGQYGNILFADDHVELSYSAILPTEEAVSEDLAYPSVKVPAAIARSSGGGSGSGGGGSNGGGGGNGSGGTGNGGTSGSGGPTASGSSGIARPSGSPGGAPATNLPASTAAAATGGGPSQPNQQPANGTDWTHSGGRAHDHPTGTAPGQADLSNPGPEQTPANTNAQASVAAGPGDMNSIMSPPNRRIAHVLRNVLGGGYLLILLMLLLYATYRYWRWQEERKRKLRGGMVRR